MRVFFLLVMSFSCFASEASDGWFWGAWSRVKSCGSCCAQAVNPFDEKAPLGSVCGAVGHVKSCAVNEVCDLAGGWCMLDRFDKAVVILDGFLLVSGTAILVGWSAGAVSFLPITGVIPSLCKMVPAGFTILAPAGYSLASIDIVQRSGVKAREVARKIVFGSADIVKGAASVVYSATGLRGKEHKD